MSNFFVIEPINGVDHAINVHGRTRELPVLLVLHGGPGYAMIDLFHDSLPELEDEFVVVNYDQRGAGLSYNKNIDPKSINLHQLVEDAEAIRRFVLEKLGCQQNQACYVLGHSMGTMLGLELVRKYPSAYKAYFGVGQVVNVVENEQAMYDWAITQARQRNIKKAIKELDCIGRPNDDYCYPFPGRGGKGCNPEKVCGFDVTMRWVEEFGGELYGKDGSEEVDKKILSSKLYKGKKRNWHRGLEFSAENLFNDPAVFSWNARNQTIDLETPLYLLMGKHDYDTPAPLAKSYFDDIKGTKKLIWFENSSHFPFYEEKDRFVTELVAIKNEIEGLP